MSRLLPFVWIVPISYLVSRLLVSRLVAGIWNLTPETMTLMVVVPLLQVLAIGAVRLSDRRKRWPL